MGWRATCLWGRWLVGVVFMRHAVQLYLGPLGLSVGWGPSYKGTFLWWDN